MYHSYRTRCEHQGIKVALSRLHATEKQYNNFYFNRDNQLYIYLTINIFIN